MPPKFTSGVERRSRRKQQIADASSIERLSGEYSNKSHLTQMILCDTRPGMTATARIVLLLIVQHMNKETGLAYPSQERLARLAGCTPRMVRLAVDVGEEYGYLKPVSGMHRGDSSIYAFDKAMADHWLSDGRPAFWNDALTSEGDESRNRDSFFEPPGKKEQKSKKVESGFQEGGTGIPTIKVRDTGEIEYLPAGRGGIVDDVVGANGEPGDDPSPFDLGRDDWGRAA